MRFLSARILRARRAADRKTVEAVVALMLEPRPGGAPLAIRLALTAPIRSPGAAPLRDRLLAAAKLTAATRPELRQGKWRAAA